MSPLSHFVDAPSAWVVRWAAQIPRHGRVLDLACGAGRHARYLAERGFAVDAVDRDTALFAAPPAAVALLQADIEVTPWPYPGRTFAAIVVVNYLHRPLFPTLLESLIPGGLLIYETFALGNERFGKPSNRDFLLERGELLELVRGRLHVLGYEDVYQDTPKPAMVQRICAANER
jgi:SAM-dependent methyltransferase